MLMMSLVVLQTDHPQCKLIVHFHFQSITPCVVVGMPDTAPTGLLCGEALPGLIGMAAATSPLLRRQPAATSQVCSSGGAKFLVHNLLGEASDGMGLFDYASACSRRRPPRGDYHQPRRAHQ